MVYLLLTYAGRIFFDQLRVPRSALLDRYASVSAAGEYTSEIAKVRV